MPWRGTIGRYSYNSGTIAIGRGVVDAQLLRNTKPIQKRIDACSASGCRVLLSATSLRAAVDFMGEVARDDAPIKDTSDGAGAQSRKRRTKIRSGRCFRVGIFLLSMFSFTSLDRILTFLLRPSTTPNRTIAISEDTAYAKWTEQERDKRQMKFARSKEIIPIWMAKYLTWHIEQRQKLRYNNSLSGDDDIKYLVVRCLEREKCGGLSDRMQPMPFYVMLANLTQRVLLIHWKKPCELENFWQPPPNGLDWRISGTPVTINDIRSNTNFFNGHTNSLSREVRMLAGLLDGGDKAHLQSCKVLNILLDGGQKVWWARDLFNQWRRCVDFLLF